jgi:hypothetical protein
MKDYNNLGVIPPPLPGAVPLSVTELAEVPPPLPVTAVAELAEAAEVPPPLADGFVVSPFDKPAEPNFRIEAIRNLKSSGAVFDEYDIEFEMESLRSAYLAELEVSRAKELEFLRAKRESASVFLRVKRAALRAERELAEPKTKESAARKAENKVELIGCLVPIIAIVLAIILLFRFG